MSRYLYLTVASPASKKTTTTRKMAAEEKNLIVLSVDDFRLAFYKEQYNENKEEYLKQIIGHVIFALSKNPNLSIILDESRWLINKKNRAYWIDFGKQLGFKIIALYFDKSLEFCLENNSKRKENKVPDNILIELYKQLEKPELSEGFDDMIEINNTEKILLPANNENIIKLCKCGCGHPVIDQYNPSEYICSWCGDLREKPSIENGGLALYPKLGGV